MQDEVEGAAKQGFGRAQDAAGALSGDAETQLKGKLLQMKGVVQRRYGDVRDRASTLASQSRARGEDLYAAARDQATTRPLAAVGAALGVGVLLGLLLGAAGGRSDAAED